MKVLLIASMLFGFSTQAIAWTVKGIGADYCGEVIKGQSSEFEYGQWILGYVSASNYLFAAEVGAGVSGRAILEAGFKFCRENPLKDWADASQNVYEQLRDMQQ